MVKNPEPTEPSPSPEGYREEPCPPSDRERIDMLLDELIRMRMALGALFYIVHDRLAEAGELDRWLNQQVSSLREKKEVPA